ncbi:MAG: LssY C-terminal domain-containing protein [Propionicimonas sp.]
MRSQGWLAGVDQAFFVAGGLASAWLAYLTLTEGVRPGWPLVLVVVFWALVAYLVLPRLHRILTHIYVPDYFIGRTRTADGLLGDPVNLALMGSAAQVHHGLRTGGWTRADELTFSTGWQILARTLARRSYLEAPVSPLFLFGRQQDFSYQQQVAGNPSQRHHVRFWKCPEGWLLPGGAAVDWLAAGTFDRSVGLSWFTLQVTHKIAADVDLERDHIVKTVSANPGVRVRVLPDFFVGYHARNGGGDAIETDGDLPVIDMAGLVAPPLPPTMDPGRSRRPGSVTFGVVASAARAAAYLWLALLLFGSEWLLAADAAPSNATAAGAQWISYLLAGLIDLGLAVALLGRRNWARLLLCTISLVSVLMSMLPGSLLTAAQTPIAALLPLAISVLVLLALSSDAARLYSTGESR